ncbi:MAG: ATP-binding cassette domain-containing protein [Pseudomonadota bacterium]
MTTPKQTLTALRPLIIPLVLFASVTNLAVLVSPLYMMQVLDRVVPSGNLHTLALLGLLAFGALTVTALVEYLRDQSLTRTSTWFEETAAKSVLTRQGAARLDGLRDVSTFRDFLQSGAKTAVDLPWMPFFILAVYLIHPLFLILLVVGTLALVGIKVASEFLTRQDETLAMSARASSLDTLRTLEREGPMADLMSVGRNLSGRYLGAVGMQGRAVGQSSRVSQGFEAASRFVRQGVQLATLSLGAYLVTQSALSAGGMIGASIILGKTIGIIEASLGFLPQARAALDAGRALWADDAGADGFQTAVDDLSGALTVQAVTYPKGPGQAPRLERVSFKLAAGECLAILGESGSGKTTLLNAMCGADPAPIGNVFLDETDVRTLGDATRSTAIGYLAQHAQFLSGTIAENIACFATDRDDAAVIRAARLAGVHGLISALPNAYETDVGQDPFALSAGQKQRIAFARAIYQGPKYLFLDEPNALLDHMGERQLGDAIMRLKQAGVTVVMTMHRMAIVNLADKAAVLERGRLIDFGARAEIVGRLANSHRRLQLAATRSDVQDLVDWVNGQFVRDGDSDFRRRASVIACEMFNFARTNGPIEDDRYLSFEFNFVDDTTCSITISEPRKSKLEAKVHKVRGLLKDGEGAEMAVDEASLATVIKLSDRFEHRAQKDQSAFFAEISDRQAGASA